RVDAKRSDLYYAAGLLHFELEQYAQTVGSMDQAVRYDKSLPEGFYYRGLAKHAQKLHSQAIKDFSKAVKLRPTYSEAHLARARSQRDRGKGKKAVPDYQLAINQGIEPEWEAHYEMGFLQYELEQYQGAATSLAKARELNSQIVERDMIMALGNANLQLNSWDKAQTYFEEILQLDAQSHQAKFGLARLYAGKGQTAEANQYLEEVLASGAKGYSLDLIKKDPFFKPMKKDPALKALLAKYF
ncbi:MAG: tetratricopeptide repeat protein, partial [Bacteroidota bacterium]